MFDTEQITVKHEQNATFIMLAYIGKSKKGKRD